MNRFGAFAVHLGISLVIFAILGYIIVFHWYPDFFFTADGGWQGIRIVAFVDLVLGPVLTLVVYKRGKPSLKFDLSCIGLLQTICLAAGVWVVYAERPIAMVFVDGYFQSMTADDYLEVRDSVPDLSKFPGNSPRWVSVRLPENPEAQAEIRLESIGKKTPLTSLAEHYEPFQTSHIDSIHDGLSAQELRGRDEETPFLDQFFAEYGGKLSDYQFLPFGTRYSLALIAYRKSDGSLRFLAVPPKLNGNQSAGQAAGAP